jgi:1-acyl-sn-glycerol-3-phosphate acyltransferase
MKWLAKDAFFRYPLVGWLMRMAGDIPVVRGQRESVDAAMASCRDRLSKKVSVMIFPEGTRTSDGQLSRFKSGAFRLAIDTGTPILPLAVHGTWPALRKGDWRFGIVDAEVRVLDPIETVGMTHADVHRLRDQARATIAAAVDEMKAAV